MTVTCNHINSINHSHRAHGLTPFLLPISLECIIKPTFKMDTDKAASTNSRRKPNKSLMWLVGQKEWDTIKEHIREGLYDEVARDNERMASILTFAINFKAPSTVIRMLVNLNPEALTADIRGSIPFHVARSSGTPMKTLIFLESTRQRMVIRRFASLL
jgi:hypothetical protein